MKKLILLLLGSLLYVSYAMSQDTTAVCGNVANLNVDVTGYTDFTWFAEESGSTVGVFENLNSPTTTYTAGSYGNVKFYYDATIGGNIVSDTLYIIFYAVPEPTTTEGVDTVCGNVAELQVYNTNAINEGWWTAYDMGGHVLLMVIYHDYNNSGSPSSDRYPHCFVTVPIPDDQTQVECIFRWTETVSDSRLTDNCIGEVEKHVVFRKVPVISVYQCDSYDNSFSVCDLNTVELCAEIAASEFNTEYVWICNDIQGSFADPTSPWTTFTPDSDVQISTYRDVDFLFNATANGCTSTDTMHVRFLQKPTANAGVDAAVCGLNYELNGELSLQQSDDYSPTCQWTIYSTPNAYAQVMWYNNPHDSIVEDIQVSRYGLYTFIVRETNTAGDINTCYSTDTVNIEFLEQPIANAGNDFEACGLDFQLNATNFNTENDNLSGTWTCLSNEIVSFEDSNNPQTIVHYSTPGYANFRWTVSYNNATCSASDVVAVTIYERPSAALNMSEGDTVVCGLRVENLQAADDGTSGFWYDENPSTVFGAGSNIVSDATVASYGRHDFYWIEYDGPADNPRFCKDTAGPWTINFIRLAQISEEQFRFCADYGQINALNYDSEGIWTTSAPNVISFDNPSYPSTTVHATALNNSENPYYTIYWNIDGLCASSDSAKVIFGDTLSYSIDTIVSNYIQFEGHTFYASGSYVLETVSNDGCHYIVTLNLTVLNGVYESVYDGICIFPNPTNDILHIVSPVPISRVEIFSIDGRRICIFEANESDVEYDVSGFVDGVYYARIYGTDGNMCSVKKFIKE